MPSVVKYSIKIISDAGLGMAMFSLGTLSIHTLFILINQKNQIKKLNFTILGLFMALQPRIIACGLKMGAITMVVRFIGGPILMSAASLAVGLKGVHLHAAIVQVSRQKFFCKFFFLL